MESDCVLKISFSGILNSDMAGFYKSCYTDADGNKKVGYIISNK